MSAGIWRYAAHGNSITSSRVHPGKMTRGTVKPLKKTVSVKAMVAGPVASSSQKAVLATRKRTATVAFTLTVFFSGFTVPLVIFPGWTRELVMLLPWAAYLQIPADIWLGQRQGWALVGGLALQAGWAAVLLGVCWLVLRQATRKVVVQGG